MNCLFKLKYFQKMTFETSLGSNLSEFSSIVAFEKKIDFRDNSRV